MTIKISFKDGIDINTEGETGWTTLAVAVGLAVDLGLYIWRHF
jgi:hypothetical protein